VDKRVLLRHTGTYVFDVSTQEQLYKSLKAGFEGPNAAQLSPPTVPAPVAVEAAPAPDIPVPEPLQAKVIGTSEPAVMA
jgi:hypothetical protein